VSVGHPQTPDREPDTFWYRALGTTFELAVLLRNHQLPKRPKWMWVPRKRA
jgi:hypothetical protein